MQEQNILFLPLFVFNHGDTALLTSISSVIYLRLNSFLGSEIFPKKIAKIFCPCHLFVFDYGYTPLFISILPAISSRHDSVLVARFF